MSVQIIGQLVNPMLQPLPSNLIRATAEINRITPLGAEAETITDSEGRYSFELVEGKYRIEIFSVDTLHKSGIVYIDGNTPNPVNIMTLLAYRPTPVISEIIEGTPEWANLVSDLIEGDDTTTQLLESPVSDDVSVITDTKQVYSNERLNSGLARNTLLHETGNASVLNQDTVYSDGSLNEATITGNKFSTRNTVGSDTLEVYEASNESVILKSTREIETQGSTYKDILEITEEELTKTTEHSLQGNGVTTSEVINESTLLASATRLLGLGDYTIKTQKVEDWSHAYTDENSLSVTKPKLEESSTTTLEGPVHNITFVDRHDALLNEADEITSNSERSITAQDKKVYELQSNDGVTTEINKQADNYNIKDSEGNVVFNVNTISKEVTLSASLILDNPEDFKGADGDTIFEVFEYSVDGSDWHTTYTAGDLYRRFNTSVNGVVESANWSDAILLQAQDGLPGDTIYIEYNYSSNLIEWHSVMATGDIYRRERTVTNSLAGSWSETSRITGYDGTEGYTTELEYQYAINGLDPTAAWHSNFTTGDHFRRERLVLYTSTVEYENSNPILPYNTWSNITQIVPIAGQDYGLKQTTVYLYQRSPSFPTKPTEDLTYNFLNITLLPASGLNGWTLNIPEGTEALYIAVATATTLTDEDEIITSEWLISKFSAEGEQGKHGQSSIIVELTEESLIPNDVGKDQHVAGVTLRSAQDGDILTYQNVEGYTEFTEQYFRKEGAWVEFSLRVDGAAIINGTLAAEALIAETITGDKINTATTLRVGNLETHDYDAEGTITVDTDGVVYMPDSISVSGSTITVDILSHGINVGDIITLENVGAVIETASIELDSSITANASMVFNTDGTQLQLLSDYEEEVTILNLAVPWDISGAVIASTLTSPLSGSELIRYNPTGTRLYIQEDFDIYQYDLTVAYDISTAINNNVSLDSLSKGIPAIYHFFFNNSGSKVYVTNDDILTEVTLGSNFDLTTIGNTSSFDSSTLSDQSVTFSAMSDDGMYIFGVEADIQTAANEKIWIVPLTVSGDITSALITGAVSLDISNIFTDNVRFADLVLGTNGDTLHLATQDVTSGNITSYTSTITSYSLLSLVLNNSFTVTSTTADTFIFDSGSVPEESLYLKNTLVYSASELGTLYGYSPTFGSGSITNASDIITSIESLYLDTSLNVATLTLDETETSNIEQLTLTLDGKTLTFSPTGSGVFTSTGLLFELEDVGKTYSFNLFGELIVPFTEEVLFINGDDDTVGKADYRMWAGAEYPINAPFSLDKEGNLKAKNADLTGGITSIEGNFSGNITASDVKAGSTISGSHISGTYIVGGVIFGTTVYSGNNLIAVDTDDDVNTFTYYDGYTDTDATPLPVSAEETIDISLINNTYTSVITTAKYFSFNGFTCAKDTKLPFTTQRSAYNKIAEGTFSIVSNESTGSTSAYKNVRVTIETVDRATGDVLSTSATVNSGVTGRGNTNVETLTHKEMIFSISINSNLDIIIKNLESVYGTDDIFSQGYLRFKVETSKENGSDSVVLSANVTLDNTAPVVQ